METSERVLPTHVEDTVRTIAQLHTNHERDTTRLQRFVARTTNEIGKPAFVLWMSLVVLAWLAFNSVAGALRFDPPPFSLLGSLVSLAALYMTVLILTTQRRDDVIANHREQLTLQLALLSEQKSAKIIELLERMRRDDPLIADRVDSEAIAMSMPANPEAVLDAIKESKTADPSVT